MTNMNNWLVVDVCDEQVDYGRLGLEFPGRHEPAVMHG
jgi:hypothetical protein